VFYKLTTDCIAPRGLLLGKAMCKLVNRNEWQIQMLGKFKNYKIKNRKIGKWCSRLLSVDDWKRTNYWERLLNGFIKDGLRDEIVELIIVIEINLNDSNDSKNDNDDKF